MKEMLGNNLQPRNALKNNPIIYTSLLVTRRPSFV